MVFLLDLLLWAGFKGLDFVWFGVRGYCGVFIGEYDVRLAVAGA